jgi:hypothetical protein
MVSQDYKPLIPQVPNLVMTYNDYIHIFPLRVKPHANLGEYSIALSEAYVTIAATYNIIMSRLLQQELSITCASSSLLHFHLYLNPRSTKLYFNMAFIW